MGFRTGVLVAVLSVAPSVAPAVASASPGWYTIQPGAEAVPGHTPLGPLSGCTLNFVFRDDTATYVGLAARCTNRLNEAVRTPAGEVFGSVVFRVFTGSAGASELADQSPIDDFALVRVDPAWEQHVSPVVRGWNAPPAGHTTGDQTEDGAQIRMYGQGIGHKQGEVTQDRSGFLATDDGRSFWSSFVATPGDSGAPVVHAADGKALGVLSVNGAPYSRGTTVERILALLRDGGFDVALVTG